MKTQYVIVKIGMQTSLDLNDPQHQVTIERLIKGFGSDNPDIDQDSFLEVEVIDVR